MKKFTKSGKLGIIVACFLGFTLAGYAQSPGVGWSKCNSQIGPFECGIVQVPLDHTDPNGASIGIALIRLPALNQQTRIGSLFFNPGGPGGSGISFLLNVGLNFVTLRERFDLVGFDPRGIAGSTALRCFGAYWQGGAAFAPFYFPRTPEEEDVQIATDRVLNEACAQRGGRIMEHMSAANVARDLDLLRQAVGDTKLNFIGYSYGSYLGITYANLFPDNFRALVVDGVIDPIAWATGYGNDALTIPFSGRFGGAAGAEVTLNEFFRLCDAGAQFCALAPNSASRFAAIGERLKLQPITFTFPDGSVGDLDYSTLIGTTHSALYGSPTRWKIFAQLLADMEGEVNLSQLGARLEPFWGDPGLFMSKRGFPRYRNDAEAYPAVSCSETDNPHTYAAWSAAGHAAETQGYFGTFWVWVSSNCTEWPATDKDRYMGPFNRYTTNPVLVVGNLFDPATPYEDAVIAANLLPNSRLLTLHGWGHTSLFRSRCANNAIARYVIDLVLPPSGTVCEQDVVPFTR